METLDSFDFTQLDPVARNIAFDYLTKSITLVDACARHGVIYSTGYAWMRKAGVPISTSKGQRLSFKKRRDAIADHAIKLFSEGHTINEIATECRESAAVVKSALEENGITDTASNCRARRSDLSRNAFVKHRSQYLDIVCQMINNGYTVNAIAKRIGRSRGIVNSCLSDMGIDRPTISEGNRRSAAKQTSAARKKRTTNAHAAIRKTGRNSITQSNHAARCQSSGRYIGFGEAEITKLLRGRGVECVPQFAWNGYNIDILANQVAVEVHNYDSRPASNTHMATRIIELLSSGIHVFYFVLGRNSELPCESAIDDCIRFIEAASSDPSPVGKYRVVRSNGTIDHTSNRKLDHLAAVVRAYNAAQS